MINMYYYNIYSTRFRKSSSIDQFQLLNYPLLTGLGLGVHRTLPKSFSFPPSQPAIRCITSARLAAAVPIVVRSNNRFAAGVKLPSVRRGVQLGGAIP